MVNLTSGAGMAALHASPDEGAVAIGDEAGTSELARDCDDASDDSSDSSTSLSSSDEASDTLSDLEAVVSPTEGIAPTMRPDPMRSEPPAARERTGGTPTLPAKPAAASPYLWDDDDSPPANEAASVKIFPEKKELRHTPSGFPPCSRRPRRGARLEHAAMGLRLGVPPGLARGRGGGLLLTTPRLR